MNIIQLIMYFRQPTKTTKPPQPNLKMIYYILIIQSKPSLMKNWFNAFAIQKSCFNRNSKRKRWFQFRRKMCSSNENGRIYSFFKKQYANEQNKKLIEDRKRRLLLILKRSAIIIQKLWFLIKDDAFIQKKKERNKK